MENREEESILSPYANELEHGINMTLVKLVEELLAEIEKLKGEKSEIDIMKEKYENGGHIAIFKSDAMCIKWAISIDPDWEDARLSWKLIHKKHKHILDAYLEDSSVEIENITYSAVLDAHAWIDVYNENKEYQLLKPKEEEIMPLYIKQKNDFIEDLKQLINAHSIMDFNMNEKNTDGDIGISISMNLRFRDI